MQNITVSSRSETNFFIGDIDIIASGDMKRWDAYRNSLWCGYVEFHKSTSSLVASRVAARIIGGCATRDDYKRIFYNAGVLYKSNPEI